jgi:large subunit ribosomal protein L24
MTLARIKKGDTVVVISGKERGKRGVVREVRPREGRAIVQDLNISKRHRKPSGQTQQAGIIDLEQPIQLSNLMPADPRGGGSKPTRVRTRVLANGTKVRIALASGEQIGKE